MENKLEQLLEKLLKLGRKPNGKEYNHIHAEANRIMSDFGTFYRFCNYVEDGSINRSLNLKLREIVSINSGLWQFVCENHLYIYKMGENKNFIQDHFKNEYNECCYQYLWDKSFYEYYLLEGSLKDENELGQFLLDNIKVDGKDNM